MSKKPYSCSDTATEAGFDASWRSLYLGLGIHSVQSAPVFQLQRETSSYLRRGAPGSHMLPFDREMTGFGVYAMRTILQKYI